MHCTHKHNENNRTRKSKVHPITSIYFSFEIIYNYSKMCGKLCSFIITFHGGSYIAGGNHVNAGVVCICVAVLLLLMSIYFSPSVENHFEINGIKVKICMIWNQISACSVAFCLCTRASARPYIPYFFYYSLSKTELPEAHRIVKIFGLFKSKHILVFVVYRFFFFFRFFFLYIINYNKLT